MSTHVNITASTLSAVRMENVSFHWGSVSEMTLVLARLLSPVSWKGVLQGTRGNARLTMGGFP